MSWMDLDAADHGECVQDVSGAMTLLKHADERETAGTSSTHVFVRVYSLDFRAASPNVYRVFYDQTVTNKRASERDCTKCLVFTAQTDRS